MVRRHIRSSSKTGWSSSSLFVSPLNFMLYIAVLDGVTMGGVDQDNESYNDRVRHKGEDESGGQSLCVFVILADGVRFIFSPLLGSESMLGFTAEFDGLVNGVRVLIL